MKDDFLLYMKSHPLWPIFEKQVLSHRPNVPPHNYKNDNTEEWKFLSAQQRGFDLCLALFQITKE
jgi:hypothetical protein